MSESSDPIALSVKGIKPGVKGRELQIEIARIVGKRSPKDAAEFVNNGKLPVLRKAKNTGRNFATIFLTDREYALLRGSGEGTTARPAGSPSGAGSSGSPAAKAAGAATTSTNDVPNSGLLDQLKQSEEVLSFGRVQPAEGTYIYDRPDTQNGKKKLYERNTRVFVCRRLPGNWYFVRLDDGEFGYVNSGRVWINPPDPDAYLYKIKQNQGAQAIAEQEFLNQAKNKPGVKPIQWGMDWRHYVRVLVYANQGRKNGSGPAGIYYATKAQKWSETNTIEGVDIWVPSVEFAQRLKDKLPSDSVTYNLYQMVVRRLGATGEFLLGRAAFEAGLLHGALEAVWDVVAGLADLLTLAWSLVKKLFSGEVFSFLGDLWEWIEKLTVDQLIKEGIEAFLAIAELIKQGIDSFVARWKDENFLRKWHFRGWVVGYAVAELLMMIFAGEAVVLAWTGKLGQVLAKFPKIVKLLEKAKAVVKALPDAAKKNLKKLEERLAEFKAKLKKKFQRKKTKPTGKKGSKPKGRRSPEIGNAENKRSLRRENEAADTLADAGYKVEQNPPPRPNGKEPDYLIEGEYFDCLSPRSTTVDIDNVRDAISKKAKSGQAERIIVNLDDSAFNASDIADVLRRKPPKDLLETIVVKNKVITHVFPP